MHVIRDDEADLGFWRGRTAAIMPGLAPSAPPATPLLVDGGYLAR